ncbi:MAG: flagellar hook-basal body protein [Phycisphaerales bacterium]|nr:flagellar hook-basal body protein [Phycisphaerales bacterium]
MIYGLYHSAAGMMVNEYRQDVLANNLANAETVGFKPMRAVFAERAPASQAGERQGPSNELLRPLSGGLWLGATRTDFNEGDIVRTEQPTDVALAGSGFLMVQQDGETLLTRNGAFVVDRDGALLSATDGAPVLNIAGAPIRVNPLGGEISVSEEGTIRQGTAIVGRLGIVDVDDYNELRQVGAARFRTEQQTTPSLARVRQGALERSGAEPITELTNMLESARAFQMNAQMVTMQDQSIGRLINAVST